MYRNINFLYSNRTSFVRKECVFFEETLPVVVAGGCLACTMQAASETEYKALHKGGNPVLKRKSAFLFALAATLLHLIYNIRNIFDGQ